MKAIFSFIITISTTFTFAQSNTEIYLFDLENNNSIFSLKNGENLSNNEGYDNQPSFLDDRYILFASTRNGQTDIAKYDMRYGSKLWLNFSEGGEYTPLKVPNKNEVSAVRLDKDGKQRLYTYNNSNGESDELIKDLVVAYYTWYNENIIVSAVIEDNDLNLYVSNTKDGTNKKHQNKVGRSFHKIPNSNLVSFISKEDGNNWQIKSLNPISGVTKIIASTIQGVEDICWLNSNTILSGKDNILYKLTLKKDNDWVKIADLSENGISKITRLATNIESTKLLIAADISSEILITEEPNDNSDTNSSSQTSSGVNTSLDYDPEAIVQKHIGPYNQQNLDAFANAFSEDVVVYNFPNKERYRGRETLKSNYKYSFENNTNLSVKVDKRMVLKNMVVDEELATWNNKNVRQATIYSTSKNGIETMTFVQNIDVTSNPEIIVNKQLEAYNKEDLQAFAATFKKDIKLYQYPNNETSSGIAAVKEDYKNWFDSVENLNAKVISRIVIGNKVIDKEEVRANDQVFHAIAIYEVENGLISKITFIQ